MKIFSKVLAYLKPYKLYIALSVVFSIFHAIFNAITIYLLVPLMSALFNPASKDSTEVVRKVAEDSSWISNIKIQLSMHSTIIYYREINPLFL